MIVKGASRDELDTALAHVNEIFGGNVAYNRCDQDGHTRNHREKWQVTLRVISSKGPGHRLGFTGRRLTSTCWHVHGEFIDALPKGAEVETMLGTTRPDGYWQDRNIGSMIEPLMFSDACDCE